MTSGRRVSVLLLSVLLSGISAHGQSQRYPNRPGWPAPTGPIAGSESSPPARGGASITVCVVDEAGFPLDVRATVRLEASGQTVWSTTGPRSEAQFDNVAADHYEIEASAPGFQTVRQEFWPPISELGHQVSIVLPRDVSGATSDLTLGQILAPKPHKDAEKGIAAMKQGNLMQAQKHFEAAYKLAPTNADVNYLLGVVFERQRKLTDAEEYLNRAISFDSRHAGALTELGYLLLEKGDVAGAIAVLEPAVVLAPKSWQAHQIASAAYLRAQNFEKSRQQAELAIRESKGGATEARLLLAEALLNLGRQQEAMQCMRDFIREQPNRESSPHVQELIAEIQHNPAPRAPHRQ